MTNKIGVVEPFTPTPSPRSSPVPKTCLDCGTEIPQRDSLCAICERAKFSDPNQTRDTILHWIFFMFVMTIIFGLGYYLAA